MKINKLKIVINKSAKEVFEFTINPENTPLWISHIKKEVADEYPPKIGTVYRNTTDYETWEEYTVTKLQENKSFTMKASDNNYFVRYTYKKLSETSTKLEYLEWVENGNLNNPFNQSVLSKLKVIIEQISL